MFIDNRYINMAPMVAIWEIDNNNKGAITACGFVVIYFIYLEQKYLMYSCILEYFTYKIELHNNTRTRNF